MKEKTSKSAERSGIFSSLKLLRALHLSRYPLIREILDSICKMNHLRYLNLSGNNIEVVPTCIGLLHNLQTLSLSYCRWLRMLPDSIGQLSNLSTLDLKGSSILQSLPSSIGCLMNLTKLDLSRCYGVQALPESLSRLSNLQVLNLQYCRHLREAPVEMKDMKSLIYLNLAGCVRLSCIPAGIGQFSKMLTIPIFVVGGKTNCNIRELGSLNIEGELHVKNLENVRNPDEAKEANLKEKQGLRSLRLSWGENVYRTPAQSSDDLLHGMLPQADLVDGVVENLQPGANINKLVIEGYVGRKFPTWLMDSSLLHNLVNLTLDSCVRCEVLPPLGQLRHLQVLRVSRLLCIRCIDSGFYGGYAPFPALDELYLSGMPMLEEWSGTSEGEVFPSLTVLRLVDCPILKSLPMINANERVLLSALGDSAFPNLEGGYSSSA